MSGETLIYLFIYCFGPEDGGRKLHQNGHIMSEKTWVFISIAVKTEDLTYYFIMVGSFSFDVL